jgi:thiamine pyrophosphokinase
MNATKAVVVANGVLEDLSAWQEEIGRAGLVVAADGGAHNARALGLVPDALVGDADSLDPRTARWLAEHGATIVRHPTAKDETDLELALLYACDAGAADIVILGGWGGRPDQEVANLLLLAHPRLAGRRVRLLGASYELFLLHAGDEGTFSAAAGETVSLLPLGGETRGVHTAGLRWALAGDTLRFGPARGVSNEVTAATVRIRVEEGLLLVVHLLAGASPTPRLASLPASRAREGRPRAGEH